MDNEVAKVLAVIVDRLESLASQNEDTARVISAIRGAAKLNSGFEEQYDKLYSGYLGLAANRTADVGLQEIRQMLSQVLRPKG
jgi:hypothetical protein